MLSRAIRDYPLSLLFFGLALVCFLVSTFHVAGAAFPLPHAVMATLPHSFQQTPFGWFYLAVMLFGVFLLVWKVGGTIISVVGAIVSEMLGMRPPAIYAASDLRNWSCSESTPQGGYRPARPLPWYYGRGTFVRRCYIALGVFTGRYDAVDWDSTAK